MVSNRPFFFPFPLPVPASTPAQTRLFVFLVYIVVILLASTSFAKNSMKLHEYDAIRIVTRALEKWNLNAFCCCFLHFMLHLRLSATVSPTSTAYFQYSNAVQQRRGEEEEERWAKTKHKKQKQRIDAISNRHGYKFACIKRQQRAQWKVNRCTMRQCRYKMEKIWIYIC